MGDADNKTHKGGGDITKALDKPTHYLQLHRLNLQHRACLSSHTVTPEILIIGMRNALIYSSLYEYSHKKH